MFNLYISAYDQKEIINALKDTLYLLSITSVFLIVVGLLFGFILFFTEQSKNHIIHKITGFIVDILRSVPFIILMILLIPVTVILVGTIIGAKAALPALIISASPFYARLVYMSLRDIPKGNIEALEAMGASKFTKIRILIKEALPSLLSGLTVSLVTLVGFIASAGAIGAGGLGDLAKRKAFASEYPVMIICIILILVIVFTIQLTGDYIVKKIDKR
ncbi:Methionine ABC transporter permease [Alteracholeplasma palmae J233]|uniref:Methionine ABC transporter permease n=1 Tax=Alteracholeplasma palmae (strain ATCC 49389 / J233) TaxID=1318466 RepID=U4KQV5_ALTPJ|nr:ABC transporter permease subunit [Alteracholeplasma palmae]CCV63636.1 Methionine ABC transporter permease [Alteracholeplasma palmae J233]